MHLGTRALTLTVDGISRTADVSDCAITSGEAGDRRRLCASPREYRLQAVAAQDMKSKSLWDLAWSRNGEEVEVDLRPAGGVTASESTPWFTGIVTIAEPDGDLLGGAADPSPSARLTFDIDWAFKAKPVRVTA